MRPEGWELGLEGLGVRPVGLGLSTEGLACGAPPLAPARRVPEGWGWGVSALGRVS